MQIRFGVVSESVLDGPAWAEQARRVEDAGVGSRSSSPGAAGGGIEAGDVWQMPTIFIGSVAQIREDLQARRERFGLSYPVTPDHELPTLAAIIAGS
jgi:hypothetical protein